jgi:hypothetical protein
MKKILAFTFLLSITTGCSNNMNIPQTKPEILTEQKTDKTFSTKGFFSNSIKSEVDNIFKNYDRNKNGFIEYDRKKNNPFFEEGIREERKRKWIGWDFFFYYEYFTVKHLIMASDSNKDSILTKDELKQYITNTFDYNKNNSLDKFANFLTTPEYQKYLGNYREIPIGAFDSSEYLEK